MPKTSKSKKTVHPTSFRLEQNIYDGLVAISEDQRKSLNQVVNTALEQYVEKIRGEASNYPKVIIG